MRISIPRGTLPVFGLIFLGEWSHLGLIMYGRRLKVDKFLLVARIALVLGLIYARKGGKSAEPGQYINFLGWNLRILAGTLFSREKGRQAAAAARRIYVQRKAIFKRGIAKKRF